MEHIPNLHVLQIYFLPWTHKLPHRVVIISERFKQRITIPYEHDFDSIADIAAGYLIKEGFNIIGKGESKNGYYLISDTFEPLKK